MPPETPQAFGLHPNAEIGFKLREGGRFCGAILSLQPREAGAEGGLTADEKVRAVCTPANPCMPYIACLSRRVRIRPKVVPSAVLGRHAAGVRPSASALCLGSCRHWPAHSVHLLTWHSWLQAKVVLDEVMEKLPELFDIVDIRSRTDDFTPYIMVAIQVSRL